MAELAVKLELSPAFVEALSLVEAAALLSASQAARDERLDMVIAELRAIRVLLQQQVDASTARTF